MGHTVYIPAAGRYRGGYRSEKGLFLTCAALSAGVTLGALYFCRTTAPAVQTPFLHQYFSPLLSGQTPAEVFRNTAASLLLFLAAAFISGLCAAGQPIGAALLIYRGFGIGLSAAQLYSVRGAAAIPAAAVLFLPKALAAEGTAGLAVRELIRSSNGLLRYLVTGQPPEEGESRSLRMYCVRFAVLAAISLFIAAADAVLSYLFSGLLRS
ncbi:MAG: hypothetical protein IJ740_07310 [Ruminococcus sp.]|nr:hypothetical protein [Ruminococcus sp.]